jgi:predicted RNA-binding protein associated with RNAse of E/G family
MTDPDLGVASAPPAPTHGPKVEIFDVESHLNIDNKGFVRSVADYRMLPFGLYMSREVVARESASWLESWILPKLGLRVSRWAWNRGFAEDYDFYIDIVDVEPGGPRWRATDLYLDITVKTGAASVLLDVEEFLDAVRLGLLPVALAARALDASHRALAGLARYGNDLHAWLESEGVTLAWRPAQAG